MRDKELNRNNYDNININILIATEIESKVIQDICIQKLDDAVNINKFEWRKAGCKSCPSFSKQSNDRFNIEDFACKRSSNGRLCFWKWKTNVGNFKRIAIIRPISTHPNISFLIFLNALNKISFIVRTHSSIDFTHFYHWFKCLLILLVLRIS